MSALIYLVFTVLLPVLCLAQNCSTSPPNPASIQSLSAGALNFTLNIYKQLQGGNNVFISPFSIRTALGMTEVGARNQTASQMNSVLQFGNFPTQDAINQAFLSVLGSVCSTANYTLQTANRIYVQNQFPIYQTFKDALQQYYLSDAVNVNFTTDATAAITQINNWVANQTNNTITDLFSQNSLGPSTVLVLVNAIYFKGTWQTQFPKNQTKSASFTSSNNQVVSVQMMNVLSSFYYTSSSTLNSQVLQLNYAGGDLVMYIILPYTTSSLTLLQSKLTPQTFNSFKNNMFYTNVDVYLPKFTLNFKQELNDNLKSMGMVNLFDQVKANLSGIANVFPRNLYVSLVLHQAFVSVAEDGTEAAAATAVVVEETVDIVGGPPPKPIQFKVDHPFIFVIYNTKIDQPLFIGQLNNPNA